MPRVSTSIRCNAPWNGNNLLSSEQRLTLGQRAGLFDLADGQRLAVIGALTGADLSSLPRAQTCMQTPIKPDHDHFAAQGFAVALDLSAQVDRVLVLLPRSKQLARGLIAQAVASASDMVIVDGQKTDGADSLLKECRKRAEVSQVISKAHGKLFALRGQAQDFADWALPNAPHQVAEGLVTRPGVFSADGIDPASALLVQALPKKLGHEVADLGAGWGYLSANILARTDVKALHLVEADHTALDCARQNLTDPRAQFHWADALTWHPEKPLDGVVMNPPFHIGRATQASLGQAFIASAARCLSPGGHLWMVANRHLPYETTLAQHFSQVEEIGGDRGFKVLAAHRPKRHRR